MIGNIGNIAAGMRSIYQRHPTFVAHRRNLAIKKKRDYERAERKRKILAQRNQ
jgi:hypothetical protein